MKDYNFEIDIDGVKYPLVFNLNVMEAIQDEYKTVDKWAELTDGRNGIEPNAKAIKFGFMQMINEALDIEAEETGDTPIKYNLKQIGRILSKAGLNEVNNQMQTAFIESVKDDEKNA